MSIENTDLGRVNKMLSMLPPGIQTEQYLQAAAQGANPQVPQFLALAQLQKLAADKQRAQQMAMAAQAGPEPEKTLKDKTIESTGVMGLLAARQAQAQQQMQGQMAMQAQATPPGMGQAPVQAAAGGLMGRRFAAGGSTEDDTAQREADRETLMKAARWAKESGKDFAAALKDVLSLPYRGLAGAVETAVIRPARALGADVDYLPRSFFGGDASSMTPYMDQRRRERGEGAPAAPSAPYPEPLAVREGRRGEPTPMPEAPPPATPSGGITELMGPPEPQEQPFSWSQEQRRLYEQLGKVEPGQSPEDLRAELGKGLPELLRKPHEGLLAEIAARRAADTSEAEQLKAGLAKDRQAAVINALLGAGQNPSNRGAFADLGRGLMAGRSQVQEREQAINALTRERDLKLMESQAAAVEAQRAQAEGRFDDMLKFREKSEAAKKAAQSAQVQIANSGASAEASDRRTAELRQGRMDEALLRTRAGAEKAQIDALRKQLLEKDKQIAKEVSLKRKQALADEKAQIQARIDALEGGGEAPAPATRPQSYIGKAQMAAAVKSTGKSEVELSKMLLQKGVLYDPSKP